MDPATPIQQAYSTGKTRKSNTRQSSVKRAIRGKAGGYEIVNVSNMMDDLSVKIDNKRMTTEGSKNNDLTVDQQRALQDQDITPQDHMRIQNQFEREDSEGQRYLNYKSISGMDCVPRLRHPSPPKSLTQMKNAREELEKDESDIDECKRCHKHQSRLLELEAENSEMKEELDKLRSQMDKMRLLAKATSINSAAKKG